MKTRPIKKINQLPVELLVEIFLLTRTPSEEDKYPHLLLSSVCRYWRRIINDHGVFWTVIHFSPWEGGEEFIRVSVTRSRSQKLSVFLDYNVYIKNDKHPWHEPAKLKDIITMFDNLLQTEGHRIKFLCLVEEDPSRKLPRAVLGKTLPVLKTFVFNEESDPLNKESDPFAIIKMAKSLENLNMNLWRTSIHTSSLSELKPSFERFINLKLRHISDEIKKQIFTSLLPSCYKLESLTVSTSLGSQLETIHLPSVITLTNLILLDVDCYTLVHQLRAPALRRLSLPVTYGVEPDQHDYFIFDEYNLSSVTQLVVNAYDVLAPEESWVCFYGSTGLKPCREDPWTLFEMARNAEYEHIDLRRDDVNVSSVSPTQFYIELPTYRMPNNGVAPPDFQPSSALSKILSKLHNLERLYIKPFHFPRSDVPHFSKSALQSLKTFLKFIFDNLNSSKIKRLCIGKIGRNVDILRLIFDLVNNCNCFALSNLDTMELWTQASLWPRRDVSLRGFAEELVNSLKLRQNAGHRALPRLEVNLRRAPLPKKCIAEAAVLGTQIVECIERNGYS